MRHQRDRMLWTASTTRRGAWLGVALLGVSLSIAACSANEPERASTSTVVPSTGAPIPTSHPSGALVGEFVGHWDATTHAFTIEPAHADDDAAGLTSQAWSEIPTGLMSVATTGATYVDTTHALIQQGSAPSCAVYTATSNCGSPATSPCTEALCATVTLKANASATFSTVDVEVVSLSTGFTVESDDRSTTPVTPSESAVGVSGVMGLWRWAGATALTPGGAAVQGSTTWQFDGAAIGSSFHFAVRVWAIPKAKSISAGANHACVLNPDSTLGCWGDGAYGELGTGTTSGALSPLAPALTGVTSVSAGNGFTCVVQSGGTVACTGFNADFELGNGPTH